MSEQRPRLLIWIALTLILGAAGITVLGTRAVDAFQRNMAQLAAIEGITVETISSIRTITGLHLKGSDEPSGFGAVLKNRQSALVDSNGIIKVYYGPEFTGPGQAGAHYNPFTIANTVMVYVRYRRDSRAIEEIRRYLDFLLQFGRTAPRGGLLFPYLFDYPSINGKAPWYSAMDQAAAASAFLWGHRLTQDSRYFDAAVAAIEALEDEVEPRFLIPRGSGVWPKEYPGWSHSVLDGALTALIGIWDLNRALPSSHPSKQRVASLLTRATAGILNGLSCFRSAAFGHFYADAGYSLGAGYQAANIRQLSYLAGLDPRFTKAAEEFAVPSRSYVARAWHAAIITGRDFLANRGLLARNRAPCVNPTP